MIKIFKFYELFGKSFRFSKAFSRNLKQKPLQLESQQNINKAKNINQKKENEILKSDPQAKKVNILLNR